MSDVSDEERDEIREEVISELRETGMHYDVMDFEYVHVGIVKKGEDYPTGDAPAEFLKMLGASAPAVFMQMREPCPLCDYTCPSSDYVLADREANRVYTYSHLIFHLVEEHGYLPPDEFIDAVQRQFKNPQNVQPAHDAPPAIRGTQAGTLPFHAPKDAPEEPFEV